MLNVNVMALAPAAHYKVVLETKMATEDDSDVPGNRHFLVYVAFVSVMCHSINCLHMIVVCSFIDGVFKVLLINILVL